MTTEKTSESGGAEPDTGSEPACQSARINPLQNVVRLSDIYTDGQRKVVDLGPGPDGISRYFIAGDYAPRRICACLDSDRERCDKAPDAPREIRRVFNDQVHKCLKSGG